MNDDDVIHVRFSDDTPIKVTVQDDQPIKIIITDGKDGASLHPCGTWDAEKTYSYLDLVSYNRNSYLATKFVPTGTLPTDTEYWQLLVESSSIWGMIEGEIADQTDLSDILAEKANTEDVYTKTENTLVEEAPMDGGLYLRRNGAWVKIEFKRLRI